MTAADYVREFGRDLETLLLVADAPSWVLVLTRECLGKHYSALKAHEDAVARALRQAAIPGQMDVYEVLGEARCSTPAESSTSAPEA